MGRFVSSGITDVLRTEGIPVADVKRSPGPGH
jgi:hypothetical protein